MMLSFAVFRLPSLFVETHDLLLTQTEDVSAFVKAWFSLAMQHSRKDKRKHESTYFTVKTASTQAYITDKRKHKNQNFSFSCACVAFAFIWHKALVLVLVHVLVPLVKTRPRLFKEQITLFS